MWGWTVGTQGSGRADGRTGRRGVPRSPALALPPPGPVQEQTRPLGGGVITTLRSLGPARATARSLAVSCTSGTLCILDRAGTLSCGHALLGHAGAGLTDVDSSWAVAKLAWLAAEAPALLEQGRVFTTPGAT